ncbi:hypothetical protein GUJ93_ZPchr0004g39249 [Zizania palustris]|uniref:Uncharacterized protein n=1 Tax=Zizania palustris TaxID=103762 RepID=A0A8J5V8B2_ZIZPA|nr:hypothetical protein GUJ93_ZPchr0004g39249 [Zizania palustris]
MLRLFGAGFNSSCVLSHFVCSILAYKFSRVSKLMCIMLTIMFPKQIAKNHSKQKQTNSFCRSSPGYIEYKTNKFVLTSPFLPPEYMHRLPFFTFPLNEDKLTHKKCNRQTDHN